MKCRKLESGVWECYAEGPRDPVTNKRNPVRKQAKKKGEAQRKVEETLKQLNEGVDNRKGNAITFEQVAWDWFKVYALSGVKNSTLRSRNSTIKLLVRYVGQLPISRISYDTMQKIFIDLSQKEFSLSLMVHAKVTADFIFQHAKKQRLRMDNPVKDVVIPKKQVTVEQVENETPVEKYFEQDELETFLDASRTVGLMNDREWFYLLAFTGMRVGELCALKWTDIFFDEKRIRVTKTMDSPAAMNGYELTPPKTLKSIRAIDIDENILAMLKRFKARQFEYRLKYRSINTDYHDGNFVFSRPKNGYPYSSKFIYKRCKRLCEKAGLSKIEGPHILRHTHITMLTEAGVDLDTIMNRVGHSDSRTTKNIYTHTTKKMKKDAAKQIDIHYGEIFNTYFEG